MNDRSLAPPEMNATPLIDVLLVLLVMLIFTLPVATHAVKLNLPHGTGGPLSAVVMVPGEESREGGERAKEDRLAAA